MSLSFTRLAQTQIGPKKSPVPTSSLPICDDKSNQYLLSFVGFLLGTKEAFLSYLCASIRAFGPMNTAFRESDFLLEKILIFKSCFLILKTIYSFALSTIYF